MPRRRALGPDRAFIDARPALDGSVVKSAQRVIQVFEFFNDLRAGATVADVASSLGIPQSSTSALLRSLQIMGYLSFDRDARTYCPTSRIALLGNWVEPQLVAEGPVIRMARTLTERTGLDTLIATANRLHVQIIHREFAPDPKFHGQIGSGSFLVTAATGHALLSALPERDVKQLVVATNAGLADGLTPINARELLAELAEVRARGYAVRPTRRGEGFVTVAVPLPDILREPMALGVSAPLAEIGDPQWLAGMMRAAVTEWLPPA